jgi:hypothetical protein
VFVGDVICLIIFSGNLSRQKGLVCHNSLDPLFQNLGIWIRGFGGCGTRVISDLFFKFAGR